MISQKYKRATLKHGMVTLPSLYPNNNSKGIGLKPCGFNVLITNGLNLFCVVYLPGETLVVGTWDGSGCWRQKRRAWRDYISVRGRRSLAPLPSWAVLSVACGMYSLPHAGDGTRAQWRTETGCSPSARDLAPPCWYGQHRLQLPTPAPVAASADRCDCPQTLTEWVPLSLWVVPDTSDRNGSADGPRSRARPNHQCSTLRTSHRLAPLCGSRLLWTVWSDRPLRWRTSVDPPVSIAPRARYLSSRCSGAMS